jgi:hypothetical protein
VDIYNEPAAIGKPEDKLPEYSDFPDPLARPVPARPRKLFGAQAAESPGGREPEASEEEPLDFRLVFLHRAHARLILVESCEISLDGAFDDLLTPLPLSFSRKPNDGVMSKSKRQAEKAPQVTINALIHELRTDGISQLSDGRCRHRLSALSTEQMRDLIGSLLRLRPNYPAITDDLILKIGDCL